jgi:rare lipoprotein A
VPVPFQLRVATRLIAILGLLELCAEGAMAQSPIQKYALLKRVTVVGAASMYNPYRDGHGSDEKQTSSGELYDPAAWTAAIHIELREQFGGVRYGKNYRPTFVLVESGEKHVIVKINDVGPLVPGRVIDLNERSMRYFDPFLQVGLIRDAKITLLAGEDWKPGPIGRTTHRRRLRTIIAMPPS